MTLTEIAGIISLIVGGLGALVTLILYPANRKKLLAETAVLLAEAEKGRIEMLKGMQEQISQLGKDNEHLREIRETDYNSREKERESKRKELDGLHEQVRNFQTQYIQLNDELQMHRQNSTKNMEKLGDHLIKIGMLEVQGVKDKQKITMLSDDLLRLRKETGKLLLEQAAPAGK
jgi:hypothetical protein